ncbi:MAG: type III-A CRISPR-associated RAMP protein Csm3 [Aggregatilineales bacterium]
MSETSNPRVVLRGRIFLTFDIEAVTGLHIGGSDVGVEIGGVDKTVIRDKLTNRPYIPGSSLRGKVRSLLEKYLGLEQNQRINNGYIHSAKTREQYQSSVVCQIFGVTGENKWARPTRLVVRDTLLSEDSARSLDGKTDLPYTEVKVEVAIDRVTSAANPRQMERVPAGATFAGAEMVYSLYDGDDCDARRDVDNLKTLIDGLLLLEDDYLGGLGSRGSGKVKLKSIRVFWRGQPDYQVRRALGSEKGYSDLKTLAADLPAIQQMARDLLSKAA